MSRRFQFIGVTTGSSQIMRLFPVWAAVLEIDARIEGRDLPIDGPPERYRQAVTEVRDDPDIAGALVTTHKVAVVEHARDLFTELDRWAELCGEVSSISKRDGRLVGHAKDPISSGMALQAIIGTSWWSAHPGAGVLCLGAGGSGAATVAHLLSQPERPARIVLTGRRQGRLDAVRAMADRLGGEDLVEYHAISSESDTDALLASMGDASVVINATGAGKDRPGSPLSDAAVFPPGGIAWDFNYRGDLGFLVQARRQLPPAQVHDGWRYFVYGWTQVIGEVFGIEMTAERLLPLETAAEPFRPGAPAPA
jgi:shikimate 5-dehydrogenase